VRPEPGRNVAASVRQRLLNRAHAHGEEPESVFVRYALERLLYRLSLSPHRDHFVLKGALLYRIWEEATQRPTRDIDLLGFGARDIGHLEDVFRDVCTLPVTDDGMVFGATSVRGEPIREGAEYEGVRVRLVAYLGSARLPVQVDIGFGDAITPSAGTAVYPTMLDLPAPVVRVYPVETVVAEKFEALVTLGLANSRMKDYYDLWMLTNRLAFDGQRLSAAIRATLERRGTPLPAVDPIGLRAAFGERADKQVQWRAFLRRSRLVDAPAALATVVERLRHFLMPPTVSLVAGAPFVMVWPSGGPWSETPGAGQSAEQ
jgi:predicted nucleotidyltransferase component of viral defense system